MAEKPLARTFTETVANFKEQHEERFGKQISAIAAVIKELQDAGIDIKLEAQTLLTQFRCQTAAHFPAFVLTVEGAPHLLHITSEEGRFSLHLSWLTIPEIIARPESIRCQTYILSIPGDLSPENDLDGFKSLLLFIAAGLRAKEEVLQEKLRPVRSLGFGNPR